MTDGGQISAAPTPTAVGGVAFAFVFDSEGQLVIVNAAFGNLSTYDVHGNGSLSLDSAGASSGQKGACWVASADGNFYTGNTGSANLSQYTIDENGTVVLGNPQAATGIPGAVDMAVSRDGRFLVRAERRKRHGERFRGQRGRVAVADWFVDDTR